MEQSKENIDNDNKLQKITVKVKIADEGYHDIELIYDKEDPCNKNQRELFFAKIASLTGIPLSRISTAMLVRRDPWNQNVPFDFFNDKFGLDKLIDGAFYALSMYYWPRDDKIYTGISLSPQSEYDEEQCTLGYCQHINSRSFWNRRVKLLQDSILFERVDSFDYRLFSKHHDFNAYKNPKCRVYPFNVWALGSDFFMYHRNRG